MKEPFMHIQNELKDISDQIKNDRYKIDFIVSLASMIARLSDNDGMNELIAQFHNHAGKLPYVNNQDIGALVLEMTAQEIKDAVIKKRLLVEANYRAGWCLQAACAPGEAEARKPHVARISNLIKNL